MERKRAGESGQAVTEFAASLLLLTATLGGSAYCLKNQWDRARCAYLVFEKAHAYLASGSRETAGGSGPGDSFKLTETRDVIRAEGSCGQAHESLELLKLESMP